MSDNHPGPTGPHPKPLSTLNEGANSTSNQRSLSFLVYSRAAPAQQAPMVSLLLLLMLLSRGSVPAQASAPLCVLPCSFYLSAPRPWLALASKEGRVLSGLSSLLCLCPSRAGLNSMDGAQARLSCIPSTL